MLQSVEAQKLIVQPSALYQSKETVAWNAKGGCDATLALAMSNSGCLVERQRLLLLGMELDKRRFDRLGHSMRSHDDMDDFSCW